MKVYTNDNKYLQAKKKVDDIKGFYHHLFWYLVVNLFLSFLNFRNGDFSEVTFWSFSTWIFWGIGLVAHGAYVFGKTSLFLKNWEERKIKEFMDNDSV